MNYDNIKSAKLSDFGDQLLIETPNMYAMSAAIDLLFYLENNFNASIPDTGWKKGFGLEVCHPYPIRIDELRLNLSTDGASATLEREAGNKNKVASIISKIRADFNSNEHE